MIIFFISPVKLLEIFKSHKYHTPVYYIYHASMTHHSLDTQTSIQQQLTLYACSPRYAGIRCKELRIKWLQGGIIFALFLAKNN